jgi:hypothetical protein
MQHVVVGDTVLAGARFDVHRQQRYRDDDRTSTHVDDSEVPLIAGSVRFAIAG